MNEKLSPREARQGRRDKPVLFILIAGLILAALVWWGVEIYGLILDENQTVETSASKDISVK